MMKFDILRGKFSDILKERIPPKGLEKTFIEADRQGRIQARERNRMIIAIYNYLEESQEDVPTSQNIQSTE